MEHALRVAVATQPRLMRELMLETVKMQSDIEVVADIQSEADIERAVDESRPDFLIMASSESNLRPPICDVLLQRHPNMKILALAAERNRGVILWASFNIHASPVEASEEGILRAIRGLHEAKGGAA
jgi:AmiR/NasT family two-component response regulator